MTLCELPMVVVIGAFMSDDARQHCMPRLWKRWELTKQHCNNEA